MSNLQARINEEYNAQRDAYLRGMKTVRDMVRQREALWDDGSDLGHDRKREATVIRELIDGMIKREEA